MKSNPDAMRAECTLLKTKLDALIKQAIANMQRLDVADRSAIGKALGSARSAAKATAARENGKKGGRPKKAII